MGCWILGIGYWGVSAQVYYTPLRLPWQLANGQSYSVFQVPGTYRMALAQEAERAADQQKSADRGLDPSASFRQSAVILADADQLETLARLRFEPRGTDERGLAA